MNSSDVAAGSVSWLSQSVEIVRSVRLRCWSASNCILTSTSTQVLDSQISESSVLKNDRTTTVVEWAGSGGLILKRYNARSNWHRISRSVRRSRASRCWKMSYAFAQAGLNVARPVMMLEQRFGPIRGKAYFASECLSGVELLDALPKMTESEQALVASAIDDAFLRMEKAGLSHGDMKASNIIWQDGELFFIDLDAAQQHASRSSWLKNHQKDRRRFLKNWRDDPSLVSLFSHLQELS